MPVNSEGVEWTPAEWVPYREVFDLRHFCVDYWYDYTDARAHVDHWIVSLNRGWGTVLLAYRDYKRHPRPGKWEHTRYRLVRWSLKDGVWRIRNHFNLRIEQIAVLGGEMALWAAQRYYETGDPLHEEAEARKYV